MTEVNSAINNNVSASTQRTLSWEEDAAIRKVKNDGNALCEFLSSLGNSRELSIAKTKLEEAVMWACKHFTA